MRAVCICFIQLFVKHSYISLSPIILVIYVSLHESKIKKLHLPLYSLVTDFGLGEETVLS